MLVIIGYIVCLGCIFGMYVLHGGNIAVIAKALPFEMITILGAAIASGRVRLPDGLHPDRAGYVRRARMVAADAATAVVASPARMLRTRICLLSLWV